MERRKKNGGSVKVESLSSRHSIYVRDARGDTPTNRSTHGNTHTPRTYIKPEAAKFRCSDSKRDPCMRYISRTNGSCFIAGLKRDPALGNHIACHP